jgi:prefoldin subunit 5
MFTVKHLQQLNHTNASTKKEYTVTTQEIIKQEQTEALEKLHRRIQDYESAVQGLKYNIESLEVTLEETRAALRGAEKLS